ncbi:hypothetical protein [Gilvimarinus xylanilyticus]|uniref:Uncharacterized protein n=1 Tax=Gilvimarinus xylanilyticus TaxID=2944139 RepID=A0A9X2KVG9_9GAMM|nr:hypothetical protein [Gilvimarinus xylanilyticus]MCP8900943.1 hypothetical protein [Gilvimarinus xylanilyticus]
MSHFNETALELSQVTDAGLFEHLAAAVLREARSDLYNNLTQPGTNAEGKPVKSPVDAISFVPNADPRHMVAVHHTTCKQADLRKKWLLDPTTVKTPKGGKSTAQPGDLVKTVSIVVEERNKSPDLHVTLALTTNEEPPEDVTREAEHMAASHQITLDIWSRSRIAEFLDNNPNGQWLRRKYLGIIQEKLSYDLLRELGRKSLTAHQSPDREQEQIARASADTVIQNLPVPIGFLAGESGFGKSVACYRHLARHLALGGCCLVLPHEVLATSITLDQAIDATLRQLHPTLAEGAGSQARTLCSADLPLLITVEDISRSGQSSVLIERLAKWSASIKTSDQRPNWRIMCPIWPELLSGLGDDTRKRIEPLTRRLNTFTPQEARTAILKRAARANIELSELDADSIAEALGCDPLLIGLHDLNSTTAPTNVISTFVSQSTERVSQTGAYMANEYRASLLAFARAMLKQKQMAPKWDDVLSWFSNSTDLLASLREQTKYGEVIRLTNSNQDSQIVFRHDRVRKWLLVDAAASAIKNNDLEEDIFSDPYFADIIGAALADAATPVSVVELARELNPLALFYALQSFRAPSFPSHDATIKAIDRWLTEKESHSCTYQSLRHAALGVLSETKSSYVLKILPNFKDRSWSANIAGLRNGDLKSGVKLCASIEPGSGALWRDRAIEHAKLNFGPNLTKKLEALLENPQTKDTGIVGGLRLAGHLADTSLAPAIEACWNSDVQRAKHLDDYLWAAAQCGGDQTEKLLSPICDAWAELPDDPESNGMPSPRNSLAAHHVAWAFWRSLPKPALRFFIKRASDDDLRWPVIYMLHGMDHPEAVTFLVGYMAERSRELEGTNGFDIFQSTVKDHWRRWQRERNSTMSKQSRVRLQEIWTSEVHDKHLRKHAFGLWASTIAPEDTQLLRSQKDSGELADSILRARLERSDQTAIPAFIEKLLTDDDQHGSWWQSARHIWSDSLTATLHEYLDRLEKSTSPTWGDSQQSAWIISELIMEQETSVLEDILLKHWEFMRFSPNYVQAAFYAATPRLLTLVDETIRECPAPEDMFKHIDMHYGIKTTGRAGVTRIDQIQALIPYLDYLSESSIHQFWEVCNERGWIRLRREYLDSRLGEWKERVGLNDLHLLAELDKELTYDRPHWLDHWVDRHLDHGRSRENILAILKQWLRSNKSRKALQIAASIIIHAGTRRDIEILNAGGDQSGGAAALIADTRFEIMRRTLA